MNAAAELAAELENLPSRRDITDRMKKEKNPPTPPDEPRANDRATLAELRALKAEIRAELAKLREATQANTPREYYTVSEAAEFLQVRPGTIYQYIARGWIRKQPTPGPRVWISHSEITRYMNGEPIPPDEPPAE